MRIRIGQLEILDPSSEELDSLIQRYGGAIGGDSDCPVRTNAGRPSSGTPRDSVLLKAFVDAGESGIPVKKAGSLLSRGGKAMRGAAKEWALRVGLSHDASSDPFDDCRVGTARAIRIKSELRELAQELMKGGTK